MDIPLQQLQLPHHHSGRRPVTQEQLKVGGILLEVELLEILVAGS